MGFLYLRRAGATLRCGARASHCSGFSSCGARALGARSSVVAARLLSSCGSRAPELRLSSCGTQASLLCGMWDLPRPRLEPVSPALAGGFLTTAPPGRSSPWSFNLRLEARGEPRQAWASKTTCPAAPTQCASRNHPPVSAPEPRHLGQGLHKPPDLMLLSRPCDGRVPSLTSHLGSILAVPRIGCVALDKSLNLSVLLIPQLKSRDDDNGSS